MEREISERQRDGRWKTGANIQRSAPPCVSDVIRKSDIPHAEIMLSVQQNLSHGAIRRETNEGNLSADCLTNPSAIQEEASLLLNKDMLFLSHCLEPPHIYKVPSHCGGDDEDITAGNISMVINEFPPSSSRIPKATVIKDNPKFDATAPNPSPRLYPQPSSVSNVHLKSDIPRAQQDSSHEAACSEIFQGNLSVDCASTSVSDITRRSDIPRGEIMLNALQDPSHGVIRKENFVGNSLANFLTDPSPYREDTSLLSNEDKTYLSLCLEPPHIYKVPDHRGGDGEDKTTENMGADKLPCPPERISKATVVKKKPKFNPTATPWYPP